MKLIKTELLPEFEYFKEETKKSLIVLHHTVSAVGKYIDDWFKADKGKSKIAVAYVIDKNGDIYELFDPKYWAWHIGSKSPYNRKANACSIGIELVNEGPIAMVGDEPRWWIDNKFPRGKYKYEDVPVELDAEWRGHRFYAKYWEAQYTALFELLDYLMPTFAIKKRVSAGFNFDENYLRFRGIVMHCNLRKDKTDPSKAFDFTRVAQYVLAPDVRKLPVIQYEERAKEYPAIVDSTSVELESEISLEEKEKEKE